MDKESKARILVVDDTPANLRLLVGILSDRGYEIRPARDGAKALSIARGVAIDLILLDINMPQMDGYEVCQQLKAGDRTKDIPVIFISALSDVLDKVKAFSVGGVDYITKPFQVEEVLARVETHLAVQSLQKTLRDKNEELAKTNEELAKTLQQLQATQAELIQSEKMVALGQLIAGVAHEINTPLGAIRSSVGNISNFLNQALEKLPDLFQSLSSEEAEKFSRLVRRSLQDESFFTSKEKRGLKRALIRLLEEREVKDADNLADTLVDMGIYKDIDDFLLLLKRADGGKILDMAYKISSLQKGTETINTATERASKVVFALKNYGRYDHSGTLIPAKLTDGLETALTLYQNQIKQGVTVVRNYADLPPVWCYPDELNQVWTNLVHNALQAMKYRGTLSIDVNREEEYSTVSVTDSGLGISPEILPKIFEPFFTTKPSGEGSGLGLHIVKKIIDKHFGKITVESQPGQTTFKVFLPIQPIQDV